MFPLCSIVDSPKMVINDATFKINIFEKTNFIYQSLP